MTRSWQRWAWMLVLLGCACAVLPGCIFGGQTGQDSSKTNEGRAPGCDEILAVPDDDVGEVGFSANLAAVQLQGPFSGQLAWLETGQDARLTVSVQYARNGAHVVRDDCNPHLRLDVIARISSDDGLLDETAIATLDVSALDRAQLTADIAIGSLRGTYDDAKPVRGELHIALQLQQGQLSGPLLVREISDAGELQTTVGNVTP